MLTAPSDSECVRRGPVDSVEAIHPGLDALLHARFEDPATVAVYADWLMERGDPRGTLMHMQSQPSVDVAGCEAFIQRHWHRWLGDVLPPPTSHRSGDLTWRSGFVREAGFYWQPELPLSRLWSFSTMRFLDELSLAGATGPSSFENLEQLPSLRVLKAFRLKAGALESLAGQRLRALVSLQLEFREDPSERDLQALHGVDVARLRTLSCDLQLVGPDTARRLVPIIGLKRLETLRFVVVHEAVLMELLPLVESRHARQLTLSMPPSLASRWRNQLRALDPAVQLRIRLPRDHESDEMLVSATSCFVPVDRYEQKKDPPEVCATETWSDVGQPLHEVDPDGIPVCGACASTKVRCHYRRVHTPLNDCIGQVDVEMHCDECGQFSRYTRLRFTRFPDDSDDSYRDALADDEA